MASIDLCSVTKTYPGGKTVMENFDLHVRDGSFTVLVGPSGCGKTTSIRMIAGLEELTAGDVKIDGEVVTHQEPGERGIAMVFQEDRLLPGCTVLENLRLVAPERSDTELTALLGELGLSGWENARPGKLSGGMRRRAAIARALVFHSPLVIMDEPFKGLDEATLAATLACVDRWLGDRTFLLVTHSPQEAERLGCRITRLDELTQTGSEKQN